MRILVRGAIALALATAVGCSDPAPVPSRPDVVLITIDTLRADRSSVYGYERPTTPFLEELASRSTVFENAYATSSWTAPSMASLFTSLPARAHGVIRGFVLDGEVLGQDLLSDDFDTLAEGLRRAGYSTFGVSTNAHLWRASGFAQGFGSFTELAWEDGEAASEAVRKLEKDLLASRPFFLWVHYLDPHAPYTPREPWFARFHGESRSAGPPGVEPSQLALVAEMRDGYDSEVAYVDDQIRKLFESLDLERDPLVVITSDHGESFFEHDRLAHGTSLFEEQIRVPLIVHVPEQTEARRVQVPVSLVDVYPTILGAVGASRPVDLAGVPLLEATAGDEAPPRPVVAELDRQPRRPRRRTLRLGSWKLHVAQGDAAPNRLYDLQSDPAEADDLAASEPERLLEMRNLWIEWATRWPRRVPRRKVAPFQSVRDVERLRALGYVE